MRAWRPAGRGLIVTSALIGVVLHVNPTRNGNALFAAARRLLNWGFQRI